MRLSRLLIVATLTTVLGFAGTASPQARPTESSKPAADAWMLTPTPYLEWNKGISPSLRAVRNKFWDEAGMSDVPLTSPGSGRVTGGSYDLTSDPHEISDFSDRAVLTATFTAHRSVLTPSERSLYSEVTLHVDEVFEDKTGSGHPAAHRDVTLIVYGGTVILHDGQNFSIKNPMSRPDLFIQPEHKYLLVLRYRSAGDFYELADSWDITDGMIRASSQRARYFAQKGNSSLDGLTVSQLSEAVSKMLYGGVSGR
jgi:hypothetical protein